MPKDIVGVAGEKSTLPSWKAVRAALQSFDRAGLLGLVQDLYAVDRGNRAFLHARLGLGSDQLAPYKAIISRWICPDLMRNQSVSISKAKRAVADYKKGKTKAADAIKGAVMRETKGMAKTEVVQQLLLAELQRA